MDMDRTGLCNNVLRISYGRLIGRQITFVHNVHVIVLPACTSPSKSISDAGVQRTMLNQLCYMATAALK